MIKATFGLKHEPFNRTDLTLQAQQRKIADIIVISRIKPARFS